MFKGSSYHLCQFLFCKNMIVAFVDPLSTYNRYEETIEQANENNGQNCKIAPSMNSQALH